MSQRATQWLAASHAHSPGQVLPQGPLGTLAALPPRKLARSAIRLPFAATAQWPVAMALMRSALQV